jgi:hypothetical protein
LLVVASWLLLVVKEFEDRLWSAAAALAAAAGLAAGGVLGEGQLQEVMSNMQRLVGGSSRWGNLSLLFSSLSQGCLNKSA